MDRRVKGMRFEKVGQFHFTEEFLRCIKYGNLDKALDVDSENISYIYELGLYIYDNIKLPERSTKGSAGYDFTFPMSLKFEKNVLVYIPTGISWCSGGEENGYYLSLYPRSSLGIKYSFREPNLVSIIDEDYYGCKSNGGHIRLHLKNEGNNGICVIDAGSAYSQAIISRYFITEDDDVTNNRTGGIGSTTKR